MMNEPTGTKISAMAHVSSDRTQWDTDWQEHARASCIAEIESLTIHDTGQTWPVLDEAVTIGPCTLAMSRFRDECGDCLAGVEHYTVRVTRWLDMSLWHWPQG